MQGGWKGGKPRIPLPGKNSSLSLEGGVQGAERPDQLKRLEIPQSLKMERGRAWEGWGRDSGRGSGSGHFEKRILATCLDNRVSSQLC